MSSAVTVNTLGTTSFLFWNSQKVAVEDHLVRIINHEHIDVFAIAESAYTGRGVGLLSIINSSLPRGSETFYELPKPAIPNTPKIQAFSRLTTGHPQVMVERARYTAWSLASKSGVPLLMMAAHFPSVQYDQGDKQRHAAINMRLDIEDFLSNSLDPYYVFIVGDLNANPFDAGISSIYGLNASSCRDTVLTQGSRSLNGRAVRLMYNPMWRFLDASNSQGTYYKRLPGPMSYDWFVLDQVLLSAELTPHFIDSDLRILTWDADHSFGGQPLIDLKSKRPKVTDHLPIVFRFDI